MPKFYVFALGLAVTCFAGVAEAHPRGCGTHRAGHGHWHGGNWGWGSGGWWGGNWGGWGYNNGYNSRLPEVWAKEVEQRMRHKDEDRKDAKAKEERYEPKILYVRIVRVDQKTKQMVDNHMRSWTLVEEEFAVVPRIPMGPDGAFLRVRLTELQSGTMYLEYMGCTWRNKTKLNRILE